MPIYDTDTIIKAGLPLNKKILKYSNSIDQNGNRVMPNLLDKNLDYDDMFNMLREQNRIEILERYQWVNIPFGITADLIERILYYRGKGILYYNDNIDKFQFLPFALNGNIDEYGRYLRCNTFPFVGVSDNPDKKKSRKSEPLVYQDLDIVYDLPYNEEMLKGIRKHKVVGIILNDSSLGIGQQNVIRYNYVTPILHLMATLMQIINAAMFGAADHNLLGVENESELVSVNQQIDAINQNILLGKRYTAIAGKLPITPLRTSNTTDLEGLFGTFNSLSNLLKSINGIANAGVFDKKAHLLQEEQRLNGSNSDDIYYNGLRLRQEFCLMVQAYYGYPIWCESKRGSTTAEQEDMMMGDEGDVDNTTTAPSNGGIDNGSNNS